MTAATAIHVTLVVTTAILPLLHISLKLMWPTPRNRLGGTRPFLADQRRRRAAVPLRTG